MDHIIVDIKPFTMSQNIMVYRNGECIDQTYASINLVSTVVYELQQKYGINNVDLCGNVDYLDKLKQELYTKYNFVESNINIINH